MGKYNRQITPTEIDWLFSNGYVIYGVWISPIEGMEYRLHIIGHQEALKYCKSERACYSHAVKLVMSRIKDEQRTGTQE